MTTFAPTITAPEAADELRDLLANDGTVHALTRHVSRSGMSRRMSLFTVRGGDLVDITVRVAAVLGYRVQGDDHTIRVNGAGMDMQYHVVYSLSSALYADEQHTRPASTDDRAGYVLRKRTI